MQSSMAKENRLEGSNGINYSEIVMYARYFLCGLIDLSLPGITSLKMLVVLLLIDVVE